MLTEHGCLTRRQRLWQATSGDVDWLLIADPRHVNYLANFYIPSLSFSGGERCWLLLERNGDATLLGDNFALRSGVHKPYVTREVVETWYDHKHSVINRDHALLRALKQIAPSLAKRAGLVEAEWLPLGVSEVLPAECLRYSASQESDAIGTMTDLGAILRTLRRQKDEDELALLRESVRAGEAGHLHLREILRPGLTEIDIYLEVQRAALSAVGRPGLVYGDFRAATPQQPKVGGVPTHYALREGDVFTLDYSVVLDGYRADFTNAMAVGKPSAGVQELFALCQAGMRGGEAKLKAGAAARDVWAGVMQPFQQAGRSAAFPHHAGHGIGLAHPETPILVPDSRDTLLAGDVVTLEPGAYVEGIGGMRIEHNYLITTTGFERLTNHVIALQ